MKEKNRKIPFIFLNIEKYALSGMMVNRNGTFPS